MRAGIIVLVLALLLGGGDAWAKRKKKKKGKRAKARVEKVVPKEQPQEPVGAVAPEVPLAPATPADPAPAPSFAGRGDEAFGKTYKIKVMVMGLAGSGSLDPSLVNGVTQVIPETLDQLGPFKAISSVDVQQMLAHEAERQMLGCSDDSCLAELGGALGADFIVTGSLNYTGDVYVLQLQLLNVGAARVDGRVSREHTGSAQALFDEARGATKILVRDILGQRSGRLAVGVSEEGATVKVDGSIVGSSPVAEQTLAGGAHRVEVEKVGFVVFRQDVNVAQDETTKLRVQLLPSAEFKRQYADDAGFVRAAAWLSLAVGVAGLGGGAALYMKGRADARELNRDIEAFNALSVRATEDDSALARREERLAMTDVLTLTAGGVGLVGIVTGVVLFVVGEDPDRYELDTGVSLGAVRLDVLGPGVVSAAVGF